MRSYFRFVPGRLSGVLAASELPIAWVVRSACVLGLRREVDVYVLGHGLPSGWFDVVCDPLVIVDQPLSNGVIVDRQFPESLQVTADQLHELR
jgi:hypothetical protein